MTANDKSTPAGRTRAARDRAKRFGLRLQGSLREGVIIVLLAICVFLLLALFSYDAADPGWSHTGPESEVNNWMGAFGAWLADVLYSLFGASALWWPGVFGYAAWWLSRARQVRLEWNALTLALHCAGLALLMMGTTIFGALHFSSTDSSLLYGTGGVFGEGLVSALLPLMGSGGTSLLALAAILCGVPLFTGRSWLIFIDELGRFGVVAWGWLSARLAIKRAEPDEDKIDDKPSAESLPEQETARPSWWRRLGLARWTSAPEIDAAEIGEPVIGDGDTRIPWEVPEHTPSAKSPGKRPASHTDLPPARPLGTATSAPPPGSHSASVEPQAASARPRGERTEPLVSFAAGHSGSSSQASSESVKPMKLTAERDVPRQPTGDASGSSRIEPRYDARPTEGPTHKQPEPLAAKPAESPTKSAADEQQHRGLASPLVADDSEPPVPMKQGLEGKGAPGDSAAPASEPEKAAANPVDEVGPAQPKVERSERRSPELIPEPVLPDLDDSPLSSSYASPLAETGLSAAPAVPSATSSALSTASGQSPVRQGASQAPDVRTAADSAAAKEKESYAGLAAASAGAPPQDVYQAPVEEGQVATAEQAQAGAADGPTLWTVEHLQSQRPSFDDGGEPEGELPSMRLLTEPSAHEPNYTEQQLVEMAELLEVRLREYGVKAEVVDTWPGPVITRFEIKPAPGVKASKISNLSKDLARSLMVKSVRVVEVIPGRPTVGIEIPNPNRAMIRLREVIDSERFQQESSALTLALGQDIGGGPVVANLGKMPHLLVAGTTGSGKSVGVNAMLISMLLKATPEELRMIMVDPKMLELSVYDGIPHLLAPVVTDMKEAANGLRWCVAEMERRYKLMAAMGVRNIAGFNGRLDEARQAGAQVADPLWEPQPWEMHQPPPVLEKLPYIVVVIDEFADMFMIVGKKVEELIARLAQKARAAGIHLILATQRPSVDVVTGLIKANIPTRMAFQVSSRVDSRTILDQGGAENLLGHGDMLYLPAGSGAPTRVHGAFVDDDEVHRVVDDWKRRGEPEYIDEILSGSVTADALAGLEAEGAEGDDAEQDALYDEAVAFVTESQRASISAVQRRFKIGYNRAARLVEAMEKAGVVSPMGSNGAREVLARSHAE